MIYQKPALTVQQLIAQLEARGLAIADKPLAEHFFLNMSYYRLAGYWWPLQADKVQRLD
ncbi:hypothetical protein [Hufsiella ginkgonis]|uniref:Abi family protein n=1 Tax=Hufsiella ginkgonis TaxID=2695274 RepID=A0A7K1XTH6_9SPHI|nr:hypothetical protein [Hufsiella ginkgonis]MXV14313.1 hypothetical protein [Hufsiella ginkgonis]